MANFYSNSHKNWPGKGMVVYPEGTRTQLPWGGPRKHGGLVVAHQLGWPVQLVCTTNKEYLFSEGKGHIGFGVKLTSSVSKAIYPKDFEDKDAFIAHIEEVWKATWKEAYFCKDGIPRAGALL